MSRPIWVNGYEQQEQIDPHEHAQMVNQASDAYTLTRAKELLCELWKQGRVKMEVYSEGDVALSAALYAVEHPEIQGVSWAQGTIGANEQWLRENRRHNEPF